MAKHSVDPELIRQLDEAKESGDTVEAVVSLRRKAGQAPVPTMVEVQAREAIQRATSAIGEGPADVHVMPHMATAYVSGSGKFISELVAQPEIASAVANQSQVVSE